MSLLVDNSLLIISLDDLRLDHLPHLHLALLNPRILILDPLGGLLDHLMDMQKSLVEIIGFDPILGQGGHPVAEVILIVQDGCNDFLFFEDLESLGRVVPPLLDHGVVIQVQSLGEFELFREYLVSLHIVNVFEWKLATLGDLLPGLFHWFHLGWLLLHNLVQVDLGNVYLWRVPLADRGLVAVGSDALPLWRRLLVRSLPSQPIYLALLQL